MDPSVSVLPIEKAYTCRDRGVSERFAYESINRTWQDADRTARGRTGVVNLSRLKAWLGWHFVGFGVVIARFVWFLLWHQSGDHRREFWLGF